MDHALFKYWIWLTDWLRSHSYYEKDLESLTFERSSYFNFAFSFTKRFGTKIRIVVVVTQLLSHQRVTCNVSMRPSCRQLRTCSCISSRVLPPLKIVLRGACSKVIFIFQRQFFSRGGRVERNEVNLKWSAKPSKSRSRHWGSATTILTRSKIGLQNFLSYLCARTLGS